MFGIILKIIDKKMSGKSKDEQMAEKKQELEKRLQDVTGQLGSAKKAAKKGERFAYETYYMFKLVFVRKQMLNL